MNIKIKIEHLKNQADFYERAIDGILESTSEYN